MLKVPQCIAATLCHDIPLSSGRASARLVSSLQDDKCDGDISVKVEAVLHCFLYLGRDEASNCTQNLEKLDTK